MESSEDEGDLVPRTVVDYYFEDDQEEPVAFSELPLQWKANKQLDSNGKRIFLRGKDDSGLQMIFRQVTAWRFNISDVKPKISVLSKDMVWINIRKPRKIFESTIRTILVTIRCLHYVKKNPEISERSLWEHLSKVVSIDGVKPSNDDLADHTSLISEAVKRDESLRKAKFLVSYLHEKPQKKKKAFDEDTGNTKPGFNVDDTDDLCSICDNGGEVLSCEGRCMRSFHATVEADPNCESLGLSDEQVEALPKFVCKNCQYKQHQCFACGKLGSSDKSSGAEVFSCFSTSCGRFYHPHCAAKLLHGDNAIEAEELQKKIADGESFTCPVHKCFLCKQGEVKTDPYLQFAVCRRCPKSFHVKCLPREIGFKDDEDNGITQRAWFIKDEENVPVRILIYCLEHDIDEDTKSPVRNHIQFPDVGCKKKKPPTEQDLRKEKVPVKQSSLPLEGASRKRPLEKSEKGVGISSNMKESESSTGNGKRLSVPASSKKPKVADSSRKPSHGTYALNVNKSLHDKNVPALGVRGLVNKSLEEETPKDEQKNTMTKTKKPIANELNRSIQLDADAEKRILAVMKDATSSITMEHVLAKHSVPSRNRVDKTVTVEKVEGSVEAVRAALQKLEKGCSIEDAKAVCEPMLLLQIDRWENKLKEYIAPFLYGMPYTSFIRHFTEEAKRKEIVDMLHYYVQDDDMIVDLCCGSNDFSCLMKKKLHEVGKKCSYKNYDILQAKSDSNFEKRDWMTVQPKELPPGFLLIMGLNSPFGVNCTLANKVINKALEFKPKLMILIVSRETERLDRKRNPYDLVWEDDVLLGGKVCRNTLCIWSRPDWTAKHKAIARKHGHLEEDSRKEEGQPISSSKSLSLFPEDNNYDRNKVKNVQEPKEADYSNKSPKKQKLNKGGEESQRGGHRQNSGGYRIDALGFAAGPQRSITQHNNSSGWLDE